jgi:prophage regulatory protein
MAKLRAMRLPEVEEKTGLKKSKLYELISSEKFPKPIYLLGKCRGWIEEEVDSWLMERIGERDALLENNAD